MVNKDYLGTPLSFAKRRHNILLNETNKYASMKRRDTPWRHYERIRLAILLNETNKYASTKRRDTPWRNDERGYYSTNEYSSTKQNHTSQRNEQVRLHETKGYSMTKWCTNRTSFSELWFLWNFEFFRAVFVQKMAIYPKKTLKWLKMAQKSQKI